MKTHGEGKGGENLKNGRKQKIKKKKKKMGVLFLKKKRQKKKKEFCGCCFCLPKTIPKQHLKGG